MNITSIKKKLQNVGGTTATLGPMVPPPLEVIVDNEVTKDGDLVHFALLAYVEPML